MATIMFWLAVLKTGGVISPGVFDNASIDIAGAASGHSSVPSGRLILL